MLQDISMPVIRGDAAEKLSGEAKYIGDMRPEGRLYAKTLRSTEARAEILSIEYPVLPEGFYVIDRKDIPAKNRVKQILEDQPVFAEDIVNYVGEPIALIVGEDKAVLQDIMKRIKVEYKKLTPILNAEDKWEQPIYGEDNCFAGYQFSKGNIELARQRAKYVLEGTYETGYQEQFYMEPQGIIAEYQNGKMTLYGSIQCPYYVKNAVMDCLGFSADRVRVVQATTGGAFGGKEDYPSLLACQAACAAIKTGKPVCLVLERDEDLEVTTKRHPASIRLKSYVDESYELVGLESEVSLDAGAYAGLSGVVLQRAMFAAAGVYHVENLLVKGKAFATNKIVSGAFRGFGSPQAFFAIEMHMEHAARQIGIEPLEFKRRNLLKQGKLSSTGGLLRDPIRLPEMMNRVMALSDYEKKKKAFGEDQEGPISRGIGISLFLHGCGFTGNGEQDHIKAKVKVAKTPEHQAEILIANVEMGQGTQTTMRKIAAKALDIPLEQVIFQNPDTDRVQDSGPTVASRTTVIVGRLVQEAAMKLKSKWEEEEPAAAEASYQYPEGYEWDNDSFTGDAYTNYSWGVNVVELEIDRLTMESKITGVWAVFDIGKSMDDRIVRGQIDGGIVQGLGYAGMEVMENRQGRFLQKTSADYIIPTAMDIPPIYSELLCQPYSNGPFGAKGLGELTLVGAPIAYALAVEDALKVPINRLPIRPEQLLEVVTHEA